jgi:hypothetical protein
MLDRDTIKRELRSLSRVKASLDKLVQDGMKVSLKDMGKMIDDMRGGQRTLEEKKGSSQDDLFGPGSLDSELDRMKP